MTFAAEIEKDVSNRSMFVRLNPRRYISDTLAVTATTNLYSMTFTQVVSGVEIDGTAISEDTAIPTSEGWFQDESTNTLYVYTTSTLSSTDVVASFYVFLTGERTRILNQDPTDTNSTRRSWAGAIEIYPTVSSAVTNQVQGSVTFSDIRFSFINTDKSLLNVANNEYSYSNAPALAWVLVNDEIQKVFDGRVRSANIDRGANSVNFQIYDSIGLLDETATFGDEIGETFYLAETGSFPSMNVEDSGTPIPLILGRRSPVRGRRINFDSIDETVAGSGYAGRSEINPNQKTLEAVCINYTEDGDDTDNREWGLCRIPDDLSFKTLDFGTISAVVDVEESGASNTVIGITVTSSGHNLELGDTFHISESGSSGYVIVTNVTSSSYTAIQDIFTGLSGSPTAPHFTTSVVTTGNSAPAVSVFMEERDDPIRLMATSHFTTTVESFTNTKFLKITLNNSFESSNNLPRPFDPRRDRMVFRASVNVSPYTDFPTGLNHADVLERLVEAAGLSVDATSFAASKTALQSIVGMTIPEFGDEEIRTFRHYVERIAFSAFAIVGFDSDFNVTYNLIDEGSSGEVRSKRQIIFDTFRANVEFQDIITKIVTRNPHFSTAVFSAESTKSQRLHKLEKIKQQTHVFEDFSKADLSSRLDDIIQFLANRTVIHSFDTASVDLDANIFEERQLNDSSLTDTTINSKIVGVSKRPSSTTISISNFRKV